MVRPFCVFPCDFTLSPTPYSRERAGCHRKTAQFLRKNKSIRRRSMSGRLQAGVGLRAGRGDAKRIAAGASPPQNRLISGHGGIQRVLPPSGGKAVKSQLLLPRYRRKTEAVILGRGLRCGLFHFFCEDKIDVISITFCRREGLGGQKIGARAKAGTHVAHCEISLFQFHWVVTSKKERRS